MSRLYSALRKKHSFFPCCTTPRLSTQPAEATNSIFSNGRMAVYDGLSHLIVIGSRLLRVRRRGGKQKPQYVCYISSFPSTDDILSLDGNEDIQRMLGWLYHSLMWEIRTGGLLATTRHSSYAFLSYCVAEKKKLARVWRR